MKKVSFIVYFPYQWFIYKNIYNKIPSGQREVVVDLNANPGLQDEKVKESIISLLKKENVFFRVLERIDYLYTPSFRKFFSDVEVIVSCWELGCVSSKYTAHIKKVNTTYGLAKELTMLRPTRSIYDVILAYGKRDQKWFGLLTKSLAIGNPRLDNFYSHEVNQTVREKLFAYFDEAKKTVLYVPTHGDLGSFREMFSILEKISKHYNVIFKPHYYTLREDEEIIKKYRKIASIQVIDDTWDTIEVMALSDVIISDNSSSIFDAMQVDKPLIVCDFLDRNFLDVIHKNLRFLKRGVVGASTYSESLEQEVKNKEFVATIKKPAELESVLENIEEIDGKYKGFRKEIIREYFAYTDGRSAGRAADVILSVYNSPREHIPGILHHAYLAYNNRIYRGIIESEREETTPMPSRSHTALVWVFCETRPSQEALVGTIRSALNEKEVVHVCVSGNVGFEIVEVFSQGEFSERVSFFDNHQEGMQCVYAKLSSVENLLLVKANTLVKDVEQLFDLKKASCRDMLFCAENVAFNPENQIVNLFYLMKYEILGFRSIAQNVLVTVSHDQLCVLEKSALFADSKVLLEHMPPSFQNGSFESLLSFFVSLDALKVSARHNIPLSDFVFAPNFFLNVCKLKNKEMFEKLEAKGLSLYFAHVPFNRWPDKKIGKYLLEIATGNFQYYRLLKLVLSKAASVRKYRLINWTHNFLNRKLRNINKDPC